VRAETRGLAADLAVDGRWCSLGALQRYGMRVKVVRTPGELRDEIGHKIIVRKDWSGTVVKELIGDDLILAGFHPKRSEKVYLVEFDEWVAPVAVPAVNLVILPEDTADGAGDS
jgi:hypothetical protein